MEYIKNCKLSRFVFIPSQLIKKLKHKEKNGTRIYYILYSIATSQHVIQNKLIRKCDADTQLREILCVDACVQDNYALHPDQFWDYSGMFLVFENSIYYDFLTRPYLKTMSNQIH